MKKLTAISILLVLLSTAAFAQLKVGFTSNIWTDAVFFEKATGKMADADEVKGTVGIFADNQYQGNELRLTFTYTLPNVEAFLELKGDNLVRRGTSSGSTTLVPVYGASDFEADGVTLKTTTYTDAFGNTVTRPVSPSGGYTTSTSNADVRLGNGNLSLASFLEQAFGDFYVKGHAWVFEGYIGNTDQRGAVEELTNFSDFVGGKLEHFGTVKFPFPNYGIYGTYEFGPASWTGKNSVNGKDFSGKDFIKMAGTGTTDTNNLKWGSAYTSLGVNLGPLSIPLVVEVGSNAAFAGYANAMDLGSTAGDPNSGPPQVYPYGYSGTGSTGNPATSAEQIAAVFRVSGKKIADFISFDVVYRINGQDKYTRLQSNLGAISDPLDSNKDKEYMAQTYIGGEWDHEIGLYAGVDLFKGFQISAGYTAAFHALENSRIGISTDDREWESAIIEFPTPLFSGIDLRLKFTGIDKLAIGLTNNVSFAWQKGENNFLTSTGGKYVQPMGISIPAFGAILGPNPPRSNTNNDEVYGMGSFYQYFGGGYGLEGTEYKLQGSNMWNTDQSDSWFALHNSLGVSYDITDRASVNMSITNRLGVYEFIAKPDKSFAKWTTDNFQIGVNGNYAFNSNISFAAGLNLSIWGMEAKITQSFDRDNQLSSDKDATPREVTGTIGEVRLAIPIQFKVTF